MATAAKKQSSSINVAAPALNPELEYDDEVPSEYLVNRLRKAEEDIAAGRGKPIKWFYDHVARLKRARNVS